MGEFTLHNVRFYDFEPKSIQCMAYEDKTNRLALSRADGSIEIWNCQKRPFLQRVIHGDDDSSVEALAWCGGRLFSAGLHGFLLEYDLTFLGVRSRTAVTGGPTWCLAISPDNKTIATGTEEGYVCLFSIEDDGVLYKKSLEKQNGRILSIAWHTSNDYIATGSVNCVRFWSLKEDRVTTCTLGQRKDVEVIVWCVDILDDLTIVSGDSRGKTCFWNGQLGTMTYSVQSHKADVLCLAVAPDQNTIYVAGVDPCIVQVGKVAVSGGRRQCWVKCGSRSIHTHDVRSLVLTADDKLYSGGVDTVLSKSFYPPKTVTRYPATPNPGSISVAAEAEAVLFRYKDRIELWRLGASDERRGHESGTFLPITQNRAKLVELHCKKDESIEWCAVSPRASWIAYVAQASLRLFKFTMPKDGVMQVERVKGLGEAVKASQQVLWLREGLLASATHHNSIQIISISDSGVEVQKELAVEAGPCVYRMKASGDGKVLVVLDSREVVTAFNLEKDLMTPLPRYDSPVTAIGIQDNIVVVVHADMMVHEFSLDTKQFTPFSREFLTEPLPELSKRTAVIHDVSFDPRNKNLMMFHDDSSLIILNKEKKTITNGQEKTPKKKKTTVKAGAQKPTFTIVPRPNQVLHFEHVKNESVVCVELDSLQLLDKLPPTLRVKKYGGV